MSAGVQSNAQVAAALGASIYAADHARHTMWLTPDATEVIDDIITSAAAHAIRALATHAGCSIIDAAQAMLDLAVSDDGFPT